MSERSTIVGVATGTTDGGVAIVRLSGARAIAIADRIGARVGAPRRLVRRTLALGEEALVVVMPAPGSFTGEDVVELHVHAGARNVGQIVAACVAAGAVPAEAGAFTRRAFEHGRISLDEAEGIAAVIGAQTDAALDHARRLVAGELGRDVDGVVERIAELRAEIEARLDFPEDVEGADVERWAAEIGAVRGVIEEWLGRYDAGARARARRRVVLAGPPNAGKSSLFNALVGHARSIVAEHAGTTRDYVEAEIELGSIACVVVDTAGLRQVEDAIERAGVERSHEQIEGADLVLWIEAADAEPVSAPTMQSCVVERVETKRDLGVRRAAWRGVATRDAASVAALREWLASAIAVGRDGWIGLLRHRESAAAAVGELASAAARLDSLELVAFHLGVAEQRLAEIRGRSTLGPVAEDLLARIFARFCIGK
jgi:tRNA modification GTPase